MHTVVTYVKHARMVRGCLHHIGLNTPSEGTVAYAMAFLAIVREGAQRARTMLASQLHETFKQIKKLFKDMDKEAALEFVPSLSSDVVKFRAVHPITWRAVFGDSGWPGNIQVSFIDVSTVARAFRWRGGSSTSDSSSSTGQAASILNQFMNLVSVQQNTERMCNGATLTYNMGHRSHGLSAAHEAAAALPPQGVAQFRSLQQHQLQQQPHQLQQQPH